MGNEIKETPKKSIWRKWWFWLIIVFVIIIIASAGGGEQPKKVGESPQREVKTETEQSQGKVKIETEEPQTKTFSVGEQVKLEDYILTVNSVESCISDNEFIQPKSGNKFIVADISQENAGSSNRDYNLWYFKLQDDKDYSYQTALTSCKEPSFGFGTLQPGMKTRGYVAFEIPEGNKPSKLIFTPDWWGGKQIIIEVK